MHKVDQPDFDLLTAAPLAPGLREKISQRLAKVSLLKNWYQFMQPFSRLRPPSGDLLQVLFRQGGVLGLRRNTQDIAILHEVFLEGAYGSLETVAGTAVGPMTIVDLGAHIGCFTLRSAWASPYIYVDSYEPGDDNRAALENNLANNPSITDRVRVFREAVSGTDGVAQYFHDPTVTVDSSIYGTSGGVPVAVVGLHTVLARCRYPVILLKIDIEGAEYELLNGSSEEDWETIPNILVETHPDPSGRSTPKDWLQAMHRLGYHHQKKEFSTVLLSRAPLPD